MSQSSEDKALVRLANDMLSQLHVSTRVRYVCEISATIFVTLFEGLCGEKLPDVLRHPMGREEEIHNCKCVIDTLSMDILNTSLSHITGEDVVNCNRAAVANLLEVFHGLLEYILDRIGSDIDSEADEDIHLRDLDDPDMVTSEVIDDILERELGRGYRIKHPRESYRREKDRSDDTDELIALGQVSGETQGGSSVNDTAEVIALGDSHYMRGSGRKTGGRETGGRETGGKETIRGSGKNLGRREEDTGNMADISSEVHTDASCELLRRHGQVPAQTWPSTVAPSADLSGSRLSRTNPAVPSVVVQPPLDQSSASSVSMPRPISTQDLQRFNPGEFSGVGLGPDSFSVSLPPGGRPETHHMFTHHLYHHYGSERARGMAGQAPDLSSSLPVPSAVASVLGQRQSAYKANTLPSATVSTNVRDETVSDSYTRPSTVSTLGTGNLKPTVSGRLYDSYDTATLLKSSSSLGTMTAGSLTDTAVTELSESIRNTLTKMKEDAHTVDRLVRTHVNKVRSHDVNNVRSHDPSNLRPNAQPDTSVQGIATKRPDKSTHKVSFERSGDSLTGDRKETGSSKQDRLPGTTGHDVSGSSRSYTGGTGVDSSSRPPAQGDDRNGTVSSTWSSNVSSTTTQTANELAARRQLSDPSLFHGGRQGAQGPGSPRRQENVPSRTVEENVPQRTLQENVPQRTDVPPRTFQEYLQKYYSDQPRVSRSEDESSYYSDGVVDYGDSGGEDENAFVAGVEKDVLEMNKKSKSVRFDDLLDKCALSEMGEIRRSLLREDQKCRLKTQYLDKVYRDELKDYKTESNGLMKKAKKTSRNKEQEFKKKTTGRRAARSWFSTSNRPGGTKSVLLPRQRSRTRSVLQRDRKRSASASPTVGRRNTSPGSDSEMLPWLLSEFPFLYLSPETVHDLWRKGSRQLELLSRASTEVKRKKSKAQVEIEEAEQRQKVLLDVMKKELSHNQRMRELKASQAEQQAVKSKIRDKRQQSTRIRRYYNDFQVQMRSKMLKKRTKEEQVFKKLFRDGLDIQKERIRELRRYAREQRVRRAEKHHADLCSLENFYKDQFTMLSESLAKEKADTAVRDRAQAKILGQMKRELRRKMEKEVREFQDQLCRDDDDAFFRQIDADRLRHQLQMSRHQVQI